MGVLGCHIGSLFAFRAVARWFWERKGRWNKGLRTVWGRL
jgi:hypothetical protein